jgi:hypothetical protein
MTPDRAETIALQALAWLVADKDLCGQFLGATGASAAALADSATDPAFLAAVLVFVTQSDDRVIAFCDAAGLGYDQPLRARYALPGQSEPSWT